MNQSTARSGHRQRSPGSVAAVNVLRRAARVRSCPREAKAERTERRSRPVAGVKKGSEVLLTGHDACSNLRSCRDDLGWRWAGWRITFCARDKGPGIRGRESFEACRAESARGMNPAGRGYSCRRASMGWRMAALKAGMRPKMMPTPAEKLRAKATAHSGTETSTMLGCNEATWPRQ